MAGQVSVRIAVEGSEQVRAALIKLGQDGKAALDRLNFDTSSAAGPKIFQGALNEARTAANDMAGSLGPLGNVLGGVGGAYLSAGAAAGGFAELIKKSISAAEDEEQAQRRITAVLLATGGASGQTAGSIEDMATRMSRSTLATKEDVENAAASLATFRNVGPAAFERTIAAAQDMAAVFGGDLQGNVMKLGLALDDPIKGMNRLRRSGLDLSPSMQEVIKHLQETGDLAGAQGALLDALAKKIGGAGAAQDQGLTGAAHSFGVEWHETLVTIGESSGFIDGASRSLDALAAAMKRARESGPPQLGQYGEMLGASEASYITGKGAHPAVNRTASGRPYQMTPADTDAMVGPGQRAKERQDELGTALDDALKQLTDEGSAVGARQRFIDQKLQGIAKANETTVAGLQSQAPDKFSALTRAAGRDYDSEHADETTRKKQEAMDKEMAADEKYFNALIKDYDDQKKLYAQLAESQTNAFGQMKGAQDALNVHLLEGETGYFDAVRQMNADWLADRLASIDAEETKSQQALDAKADQYQKDGVAFTQYEENKTAIVKDAADKRAQAQAESASKGHDVTDAQRGSLGPMIDKGSKDLNQSLKSVAADGLTSLETGFLDVIKGTENVSDAFRQMGASILEDMAKLVLEKQVIAPLAGMLNGLIDGSGNGGSSGGGILGSIQGFFGGSSGGSGAGIGEANGGGDFIGSANGNAFDRGHVMAFASGGIVDGPTVVPMALMGEAGPEAIVPLARGSNGKLGLASSGGGGDVHNHFSPNININGGASDDQIAAVQQAIKQMQSDFFSNSVQAYAQMKSRRIG